MFDAIHQFDVVTVVISLFLVLVVDYRTTEIVRVEASFAPPINAMFVGISSAIAFAWIFWWRDNQLVRPVFHANGGSAIRLTERLVEAPGNAPGIGRLQGVRAAFCCPREVVDQDGNDPSASCMPCRRSPI